MDDMAVLEAADNVYDGVHFSDVGKELVTKTFTLGSAFHEPCDVHEFNDCGRDLC